MRDAENRKGTVEEYDCDHEPMIDRLEGLIARKFHTLQLFH